MKTEDMSPREYYSAYALAGLLANPNIVKDNTLTDEYRTRYFIDAITDLAYRLGIALEDRPFKIEDEK